MGDAPSDAWRTGFAAAFALHWNDRRRQCWHARRLLEQRLRLLQEGTEQEARRRGWLHDDETVEEGIDRCQGSLESLNTLLRQKST